jgi:hypothetical protein
MTFKWAGLLATSVVTAVLIVRTFALAALARSSMDRRRSRVRVAIVCGLVCASTLVGLTTSAAPDGSAKTAPLRSVAAPIAVVAAGQSSNWFGYNQGTLEQQSLGRGATTFHAITGDWNVPKVKRHVRREDEYSATWAGIGGGCVDAACNVGDNTLIQAGTEQDVVSGRPQYSAWWEIVPAPSVTITTMKVTPGDHIHVDIHETITGSEIWSITLADVSRNESFTQTVSYSSSYATAEWIEETPLIIGTGAGLAALPKVARVVFDNGTTNGGSPGLVASEKIKLVNSRNGRVYAVPSSPDGDANGFVDCAWARSCPTPSAT